MQRVSMQMTILCEFSERDSSGREKSARHGIETPEERLGGVSARM